MQGAVGSGGHAQQFAHQMLRMRKFTSSSDFTPQKRRRVRGKRRRARSGSVDGGEFKDE